MEETINNIIEEVTDINTKNIDSGKTLDSLNFDSLDRIDIAMRLEDKFDINIPNYIANDWITIGDIYLTVNLG